MPTVRQQLTTQVLTLLESSDDVLALFPRVGNRNDAATREGWLRDMIAKAPADFRRFSIDFPSGTHGMFTRATGFAADDPNFHEDDGCDFDVMKTLVLTITVREERSRTGDVSYCEEPIIEAIFRAGTCMGLPELVERLSEATWTRRDTTGDERPKDGVITVIRIPITTIESGRALLSA